MIVVKVGGSLYDLPDVKARLTTFLAKLNDDICLIPGGGAIVDVIREWDRVHGLGEETSHWLAIRAMDTAGVLLTELVADALAGASSSITVLDVEAWTRKHDGLPHSWDVTSDSIAAYVAKVMNAHRLILLKSTHARETNMVDNYFATIRRELSCDIDIVNLRDPESPPMAMGGL